jgi:dipeptidyl aminopeptidase/acylaminoacyl peptidase
MYPAVRITPPQICRQENVPSKLLLFPDEGHWILKPQNGLLWYHTVLDWIGEWTKP